jgi:hypothetical protein
MDIAPPAGALGERTALLLIAIASARRGRWLSANHSSGVTGIHYNYRQAHPY